MKSLGSAAVATWNVNSVKARFPHLLEWLLRDTPDIVLLQETKCVDDAFPRMEIEDLGYNLALHGEKTYNGVAILSKFPLDDVRVGLPGDNADTQARYIEAIAETPGTPMRVVSVYVPNGQEVGSDKYAYKLRFLSRLRAHLTTLLTYEERLVVGGDYNIAPYDIDVHNVGAWMNTVLYHPRMRAELRTLLNMGLYDAFRLPTNLASHALNDVYSWWDYRAGAFERDDGLRIDHLLLSPQAADRLVECTILKDIRAQEKASDHAPVIAMFSN